MSNFLFFFCFFFVMYCFVTPALFYRGCKVDQQSTDILRTWVEFQSISTRLKGFLRVLQFPTSTKSTPSRLHVAAELCSGVMDHKAATSGAFQLGLVEVRSHTSARRIARRVVSKQY